MRRRLAAVAFGAALALTLAACSSGSSGGSGGATTPAGSSSAGGSTSASSSSTAQVKMEYLPYTGSAPMMLGLKQGIYAQHGIDLKLTKAQAVTAILASLVNGEQQIGFTPIVNLIQARSRGTDIKCLGTDQGVVDPSNTMATLLVVKKGSSITSAAQLAGKKVGVAGLGGLNHLFVLDRVEAAGGDWTKVQVVQIPLPQQQAALEQGRVDAIVSNLPFTTQIMADGAQKLASQETDLLPNGTGACWAATDKWINAHPQEAQDFIAGNEAALNYAKGHVKDALATLPSFLDLTPAQAAKAVPGSIYDPKINVQSVQMQMDLMVKYKFIPKAIPISDIIENQG